MKWTWGTELCTDTYRIGEDKYESRLNGNLQNIYYTLKQSASGNEKGAAKSQGDGRYRNNTQTKFPHNEIILLITER